MYWVDVCGLLSHTENMYTMRADIQPNIQPNIFRHAVNVIKNEEVITMVIFFLPVCEIIISFHLRWSLLHISHNVSRLFRANGSE